MEETTPRDPEPASVTPPESVRPQIARTLDAIRPGWRLEGGASLDDLVEALRTRLTEQLTRERGELDALDRAVVEGLARHEMLTRDIEAEFERRASFGARMADAVAAVGGSWGFILGFMALVAAWIAINTQALSGKAPFDPYPYILLNLALSCIAAIQAPVIMMSQRRLETKDRLRAQNDYRVNLKAELEIRQLHEKIDHLMRRQSERLGDIERSQLALLAEIGRIGA